jgi:hypothetical protein
METTRELLASVAIKTIETKMKLSLEDIEKNNPQRLDLIGSLRESLEDVYTVMNYMDEIKENLRIEAKTSFRLADLNAELRMKLAKREEELIDLKREI